MPEEERQKTKNNKEMRLDGELLKGEEENFVKFLFIIVSTWKK